MQQLSFLPGEMTPGERSLIQRALKTLDRHLHEPGVAFTSTRAAREWLILNMAGLEREEFRVLYLNNQNQLIAGETLFTGTINRTEVHPREVIKRALYHNAAAVVLAHNHPSGEVTPSKADRLITDQRRHRHHLRLLQKMRRPDKRQQRKVVPRQQQRKHQRRQAVRRLHLRAKLLLNPRQRALR
ncbi:JAB domain-containing protein [Escherichia coli]|uniref:JAB domain-containing protein n=1 Tax=Escherichia coli TaxID=562 RepID=UPI00351AD21D